MEEVTRVEDMKCRIAEAKKGRDKKGTIVNVNR